MTKKKGHIIRMSITLIAITLLILGSLAVTAAFAAVTGTSESHRDTVGNTYANYPVTSEAGRGAEAEELTSFSGNLIEDLPVYNGLKAIHSAFDDDGLLAKMAMTSVRDYVPETGDVGLILPICMFGICLSLMIMAGVFRGPRTNK